MMSEGDSGGIFDLPMSFSAESTGKMKLKFAVIVMTIFLAGCGASGADQASPQAAAPTTENVASNVAIVGEERAYSCSADDPCDLRIKVEEIKVTATCPLGVVSHRKPFGSESKVVTVSGEINVIKNSSDGTPFIFIPEPVDDKGFVSNESDEFTCEQPKTPHWTNFYHAGDKVRAVESFVVPTSTKQIKIRRTAYDLPEMEVQTSSISTDSKTSEPPAAPTAVASQLSEAENQPLAPIQEKVAPAPIENSKPSFDPNSADGYGPGQKLPPLCVRFPNDFDCNGNPLPKKPNVAPAPAKQYPTLPNGNADEGQITTNFFKCMQAGGTAEACRQ